MRDTFDISCTGSCLSKVVQAGAEEGETVREVEVTLYEEGEGEGNREGVDGGGADVVEAEDVAEGDRKRMKGGQRQ